MNPFQQRIWRVTKKKYLPFKIKNLPSQIEKKELEKLVIQLRKGDKKVINKIVEGHLCLALSIAARWGYLFANKIDDIVGVAQLELVNATYRAITNLKDNNITFYLSASIHGAIKEFVENDNVINMPSRTIRYYIKKGDIRADNIPKEISLLEQNPEFELRDQASYIVPEITKDNEEKLIEVQELINKITNDYLEKKIIFLRAQGYTYDEIGPKVGYSSTKICIIVQSIEKKFNKLYKG